MQYVVLGLVALCRKTHVKKYPAAVAPPKVSALRMLFETALGYAGWTWGIGLAAAWIQPGAIDGWQWSYKCPNVMLLGYYATAVLMAYDAYSYPLHKWMHENKTAFNLLHKKHHEQKAALDATTSGYMALTEGVVSGVIPIAISYGIGMATGNWWFTLAGAVAQAALRKSCAPRCQHAASAQSYCPSRPRPGVITAASTSVYETLWTQLRTTVCMLVAGPMCDDTCCYLRCGAHLLTCAHPCRHLEQPADVHLGPLCR